MNAINAWKHNPFTPLAKAPWTQRPEKSPLLEGARLGPAGPPAPTRGGNICLRGGDISWNKFIVKLNSFLRLQFIGMSD